jgi:hypothetical protein
VRDRPGPTSAQQLGPGGAAEVRTVGGDLDPGGPEWPAEAIPQLEATQTVQQQPAQEHLRPGGQGALQQQPHRELQDRVPAQ